MVIAGLGLIRFPGLILRMHASSKAGTLGTSLVLIAVAFYFRDLGVTTRALITIIFLYITTPVAAHLIARAAYFAGTPLWKGTVIDELSGLYNKRWHTLNAKKKRSIKPAKATKKK